MGSDADPGSVVEPGDLIGGRYRVEDLIARGGQASVWRARQEPLQRRVALKILTPPPSREESEPFQERFLLEAQTLASLTHPHIVVVYDFGEVRPGIYYIAMEYVEGQRFSAILRERPLEIPRVLRLIHQVCRALRYAHHQGVIHRDIKNANLLVHRSEDGEETVKVVDFGIVKLMEADPGITQEGVILGSPHFMAPEQIQGKFFDQRADIYAVGILLYCGVVGRYPFRGADARTIMSAHLNSPVPPLHIKDPRYAHSAAFHQVIYRCLAKDPEERFPDMDALLEALTPFLDPATAPLYPPPPPPEPLEIDPLLTDERPAPPQILDDDSQLGEVMDDPNADRDNDPVDVEAEEQDTVQAAMALHPLHEESATQQSEPLPRPAPPSAPRDLSAILIERSVSTVSSAATADVVPPAPDSSEDDLVIEAPEAPIHAERQRPLPPRSRAPASPREDEASQGGEYERPAALAPVLSEAVVSPRPDVVVPQEDEAAPSSRLMQLWGVAFVGTLLLLGVVGWAIGWF